jgi:exonuclease III
MIVANYRPTHLHNTCTWNINGFPYNPNTPTERNKLNRILDNIEHLAKTHQIIKLQEIHLPLFGPFAEALNTHLPKYTITYSNGTTASNGVATIYTPQFTDHYNLISSESLVQGRVLRDRWDPKPQGEDNDQTPPRDLLSFDNNYFPSKSHDDKIPILTLLIALDPEPDRLHFHSGDWNFITDPEDCALYTKHYQIPAKLRTLWSQYLTHYKLKEAYQPLHTFHRRGAKQDTNNGQRYTPVSSRIDRAYNSLTEAHLALTTPTSTIPTLPHLSAASRTPSDHTAVSTKYLHTTTHTKRKRIPSIPRFVITNPRFREEVARQVTTNMRYSHCPHINLERLRKIMHRVSKEIIHTNNIAANTHLSKVQATIKSLRLLSMPTSTAKTTTIKRIGISYPSINHILTATPFNNTTAYNELIKHLNQLYHTHQPTHHQTTNFIQRAKRYLPSDRIKLTALRDPDPHKPYITEPILMAAETKRYWQNHWTPPPDNKQSIDAYLADYPQRLDPQNLTDALTQDHIERSITAMTSDAPGLDGIPPTAYKAIITTATPFLLAAARSMSRGKRPPDKFNHTILRTPPKKSPACDSKDTRPLQTPTGANRIIARAEQISLLEATIKLLQLNQKAFLPGKDFKDHIKDLSTLYYSSLTKKQQHFILFLDLQKAFDAITHQFLFALLHHINMPQGHINLIRGLFSNLTATPTFGPHAFFEHSFRIFRGTKQGCPLSPLLFLLVIDTLLYTLNTKHKTLCTAFGMADDVAIHILSITTFPMIAATILAFCTATGSAVNQNKSMLLPSFPGHFPPLDGDQKNYFDHEIPCLVCNQDDASILLCDICNAPYHSHCLTPPLIITPDTWQCPACVVINNSPLPLITFTHATTYLGVRFAINNSPALIFAPAIHKLQQRVATYMPRKTSFSIHQRIIAANVFMISIFNYLSSIYLIPPKLIKTIYATIGTWTSPKGSFETELLTHPRDHFGFTQPLKDIPLLNAALILSATNTSTIQVLTKPPTKHISYPHTCITSDHLKKAIEIHLKATRTDITTTPTPPDKPFPTSAKNLYKSMNITIFKAELRTPKLARKIRLLHKDQITYTTATDYSRNLMHNFSSLPKSIPEHYRGIFIRLIYNALPFRGRIHRFVSQTSTHCIFCNCDHETTLHLFFTCHIVQAAKQRLKDYAPSLRHMTFSAGFLMEPQEYYINLYIAAGGSTAKYAALTDPKKSTTTKALLPTFYFGIAVWQARLKLLDTNQNETPHDDDNSTRAITKTFYDICMDRHSPSTAFPGYLDPYNAPNDLDYPAPKPHNAKVPSTDLT